MEIVCTNPEYNKSLRLKGLGYFILRENCEGIGPSVMLPSSVASYTQMYELEKYHNPLNYRINLKNLSLLPVVEPEKLQKMVSQLKEDTSVFKLVDNLSEITNDSRFSRYSNIGGDMGVIVVFLVIVIALIYYFKKNKKILQYEIGPAPIYQSRTRLPDVARRPPIPTPRTRSLMMDDAVMMEIREKGVERTPDVIGATEPEMENVYDHINRNTFNGPEENVYITMQPQGK